MVDDEDNDDEVMLVNPLEQQPQQEAKENDPRGSAEIEISSNSDVTLSPAQQTSSDCIVIDTDLDQNSDVAPGQYDNAPEEVVEEDNKMKKRKRKCLGMSDAEGSDSNALYCICRQKQDKR